MKFRYMKMGLGSTLVLGLFCHSADAQTNAEDDVIAVLNDYLIGSSYNDPERIKSAFYPDAEMFLDHPEEPIFLRKPGRYADGFANREKGVFNGRYGKILGLDIEGNIATAKAEILLPSRQSRYIDIFLLKKLEGEWKIISKAAGRADSTRSGEKFLLIATDKGTGEEFSDLIADYEQAVEAGYTVDFVSPKGGAISFINMDIKNPKHRNYIYNSDFMYALKHTLSASNADASNYISARYICDQDAKKLKSGNMDIYRLYSEICAGEDTCIN